MRLDYTLYALAIVFFLITAVLFFIVTDQNAQNIYMIVTVTVGALSLIVGYCMKPQVKTAAVQQPAPSITQEVVSQPVPQAPVAVEAPVAPAPKAQAPAMKKPVAPPAPAANASASELTQIRGISKARANQLKANGIKSIKALAEASPTDLAAKLEVSPKIVKMWIGTAKKLVK